MDHDHFRLKDDETMRRLRTIAQSPGELQWRMELLATLERMRLQAEVSNTGILQMLQKVQKDVSHLTPVKLAEIINAQIEEKFKPARNDLGRARRLALWLLDLMTKLAICGAGVYFAGTHR